MEILVLEIFFSLDFIIQFFVEYTPDDSIEPVRNLFKTSLRYAQNEAIVDLIPLIPFNLFFKFPYSRLFLLLKCMRIKQISSLLDTNKFMNFVYKISIKKVQKYARNEVTANNQIYDYNGVTKLIWISNIFKVVRLAIILFLVSYFFGSIHFIYSDLLSDIQSDDPDSNEHFIEYFGLKDLTSNEV